MDSNQENQKNILPSAPTDSEKDKDNKIENDIDHIISEGVSQQDVRTANLLHSEIGNEDPGAPKNDEQTLAVEVEPTFPAWLNKFREWREKSMSDFVFLLWLAVIIGIFSGFGAHIFNRMIAIVAGFFLDHIRADRINWWLIFVPVGGIVLAGIYTRYVIHTDLTHGVTRMMHCVYRGEYLLKWNLIYSPIIGSTITLGLGGSAGSEGPIAISGAAIGSNLGKWMRLKMPLVKVMVGCGAAAGISGIFQSPVGGLLFTLEFLKMEIGTLSILAVLLASLVSYGMVFLLNGCHVPTQFYPADSISPHEYGAVILLGFLCGLYSLYYTQVINKTDNLFIKVKNPWIRNLAGGLSIGICLLLFPSLYGVGYPVMSDVIHSQFEALSKGDVLYGFHWGEWGLMIAAALILIIKCWACGACNASGGVSSDFAPTLYAGAIAGFLFAYFGNHVLHTHLPIPAFILLGMAAVMAGCIEAPMMSIFIVLNMGTDFAFALAIIMAVYSSFITVRVCSHIRGYNGSLVSHLEWFHAHESNPHVEQPLI